MKRLLVAILLVLSLTLPAFAADVGTITVTSTTQQVQGFKMRCVLTISITADGSGNATKTISAVGSDYNVLGWYLYAARTVPGTTSSYTVALNRTYSAKTIDVSWGLLASRSTSNVEDTLLATSVHPFGVVDGNYSLSITGMGAAGTATLILIFTAN